jgi:protease-4
MFFIGAFSGCLVVVAGFVLLGIVIASMAGSDTSSRGDVFGDKVAIIPIDGEILGSREVIDALHRYARNSSVKAIIMRINSPGGAIAPSQEIYEEIRNVRARSGKPIVASLDSVAASGGYYIASACDRIVANPGSITGSIGVILQWMETKDLLAWAKLKPETITSGPMKAAGSPYQDLTDAQRAYFQGIVMQLHSQFVRAVAAGRKGKLSVSDVSKIADGRVFTGEQAVALKLVDQLGNLDDAISVAGKLGGISGHPGTIYPKKRTRGLFDLLSSDDSDTETAIGRILSRRPRFLYQW